MKNFTKTFIFLGIALMLIGGSFAVQNVSVDTVEAYGSSCGGCGDGGTGEGPGGGGDNFVFGCTDPAASNYNAYADRSDGSCTYPPTEGCTDIFATNYDIRAEVDDGSCTYPEPEITTCKVTASAETIESGSSVTISWETEGFDIIKLNGVILAAKSGQKTFTNVTENTTYTLTTTNDNGDTCNAMVAVKCLPPVVKECELDIHKTVNKHTAKVGDEVTYTITVKNTGDADCTGGGVKIFDVVDANLQYKSHTLTSNLSAGYGNQPVYSSADRTLRFNGHILTPGESGTIHWIGKVTNPTQCGDFTVKNQAKTTAKELNDFQTWVYSETVQTDIDNDCVVVELPSCDAFVVSPLTLPAEGGNVTLTWSTTNADSVVITPIGPVAKNNTTGRVVNVLNTTTFQLIATNSAGEDRSCIAKVVVEESAPLPACTSFEANPSSIVVGASSTLSWKTTDAVQVFLNNAIGEVAVNGSQVVAPLETTIYKLTLIGAKDETVECEVPVTVTEDPVPVCKYFTATPSSLPVGGGDVTFAWEVTDATSVAIAPTIGNVALTGTTVRTVTQNTNYVLTAIDSNGDETTCAAPVTVATPEPVFSCANNVNFSASASSIRRGSSVNLVWSTTGVDTVSISGINATALSGNQSVTPASDTTYTLTATKSGFDPITCPVTVDVTTGGGGGGSSSPRCDLDISDTKITLGEEITLEWDTSRATEVTLTDDRGNVLFTTDDYLAKDKEDYFDGSITIEPTRDTEYTLLAERGRRDRECKVEVEVEDTVVVLQTRDQQPLVTGISLTQVPYTGFEAGPFMTTLFYVLLVAWSLFITYLLVIRNRMVSTDVQSFTPASTNADAMKQAEAVRPDVFAPSVMTKVAASQTAPANLPTGIPVAGQDVMKTTAPTAPVTDSLVTALENQAHAQKALLSSDAVRHFITVTEGSEERTAVLDQVIVEAKKTYPLEDGWIVLNEARMQSLCSTDAIVAQEASVAPAETIPAGSGSLAESIVTGNVVAAYALIGHRPMVALADAAADLDAVYRNRKGESNSVSDMLTKETQNLSDTQITEMISALTGALDGTYTDEASAVKMAIMKAVKVAA